MRIALRTSGGRGEYELAGHQGDLSVDDLLGRDMLFEYTPRVVIDGHSSAQRVQGKPRIRLENAREFSHAYAIAAAVLLLPQPKRELSRTSSGSDFIYDNQYSITDIDVDVANLQDDFVSLRPTALWMRNTGDLVRSVDVAHRFSQVQALWDSAQEKDSKLAALVRLHERAVVDGIHGDIKAVARAIRKELDTGGDVLNAISAHFEIAAQEPAISTTTNAVPDDPALDDIDPNDAARRAVARWRQSVVRNAAGRAFSQKVRAAYSYRCALSGDVLPKLPHTASPGVDGAHILPWARYELNSLRNGICLNKLCHWAFDAGIIRIDSGADNNYFVSIPDRVRDEGLPMGMSLDYFISLEGKISGDRFPASEGERPSALYLDQLNAEMFG
jgi:hypothetical protein